MNDMIPRIEYDELDADLKNSLRPRYERLNYLGEFFKCCAHQPDTLKHFIEFSESAKSSLDKKLAEAISLTCATYMNNCYEKNQHERLSIRLGFGKDWIVAIEQLKPDRVEEIEFRERIVQRYLIAALERGGHDTQQEFNAVLELLGIKDSVAVLMLMARYVAHAHIVNTLALKPPVSSIFDDGFEGD